MPGPKSTDSRSGQTEIVHGVAFVAHDDAPVVLQPRPKPLNLPAAQIAAQRPTVLRRGLRAVLPMRNNQFDALFGQLLIERIAIVSHVPNQPLWAVL